jgi:hypothetical protein
LDPMICESSCPFDSVVVVMMGNGCWNFWYESLFRGFVSVKVRGRGGEMETHVLVMSVKRIPAP